MAGSRFDVRMAWTPLSAAASSSSSPSSLSSSSIAVGSPEAGSCGQEAGQYRVRPTGLDSADFLFAAGPGEPLRPLSAVASGGESARVMLALKAAPAFMAPPPGAPNGSSAAAEAQAEASSAASSDGGDAMGNGSGSSSTGSGTGSGTSGSQVLILDEIDSGVGSRLGQPIGRILRRMAAPQGLRVGQILCVSHLPQASTGTGCIPHLLAGRAAGGVAVPAAHPHWALAG